MIYDFHKGSTAERITNITKSKIKRNSKYFFEPINNIEYDKIEYEDERFFYKNGEDVYLMFAYLKKFYTKTHNKLPRYHICKCATREQYSGYSFASSMPVKIFCRDENRLLDEPKHLKLCKNCTTESFKGLFSFLAKGKPWYEYVLEFASSENKIAKKRKSNGYVVLWKQISEAVRERNGFKCEKCKIKLGEEKYYLEVHHKDHNKSNNDVQNLQPLCVLCHATVDEIHLTNFKKEDLKVESFISAYGSYIKDNNESNLLVWRER